MSGVWVDLMLVVGVPALLAVLAVLFGADSRDERWRLPPLSR